MEKYIPYGQGKGQPGFKDGLPHAGFFFSLNCLSVWVVSFLINWIILEKKLGRLATLQLSANSFRVSQKSLSFFLWFLAAS